jgi:hypothetical protein
MTCVTGTFRASVNTHCEKTHPRPAPKKAPSDQPPADQGEMVSAPAPPDGEGRCYNGANQAQWTREQDRHTENHGDKGKREIGGGSDRILDRAYDYYQQSANRRGKQKACEAPPGKDSRFIRHRDLRQGVSRSSDQRPALTGARQRLEALAPGRCIATLGRRLVTNPAFLKPPITC